MGALRPSDFEVQSVHVPYVGVRYFVRRRVRLLGIPIPFVRVRVRGNCGLPMFFSAKDVDDTIRELTHG